MGKLETDQHNLDCLDNYMKGKGFSNLQRDSLPFFGRNFFLIALIEGLNEWVLIGPVAKSELKAVRQEYAEDDLFKVITRSELSKYFEHYA